MFELIDNLVSPFLRYNLQVIHSLGLACLALTLLLAIVFEITAKKIPNYLTYCAVFVGLLLILWDGAWTVHLFGLFVALVSSMVLFANGKMPGGCAKLLAAVGCIGGPLVGLFSTASIAAILLGRYVSSRSSLTVPTSPFVAVGCAFAVFVLLMTAIANADFSQGLPRVSPSSWTRGLSCRYNLPLF